MNKKLYVYICICMAVTLLFSCFTAGAASITPSVAASPTAIRAYLDETYIAQRGYDDNQYYPLGNYNVAVYTFTVSPIIQMAGDGYLSGSGVLGINFDITVPTGWTKYAIDKEYDTVYTNTLASTVYSYRSSVIDAIQLRVWTSNCYYDSWQGLGDITCHILLTYPQTPTNEPDPEPYIGVMASCSWVTNTFSVSATPDSQGMIEEIIYSIDHSNLGQDINEMYNEVIAINTLLDSLKTQQTTQYTNLLNALNTCNNWLYILNGVTGDIEQKLEELYTLINSIDTSTTSIKSYTNSIKSYTNTLKNLMSNFPTYSAKVLEYLGKLAEMNADQATEAAAIESEYADIKDQQDAANTVVKNVPRPSAPEINISDLTDQQTRQTFNAGLMTILSFPFIERLLIIVFTFATVGFILYGRKK